MNEALNKVKQALDKIIEMNRQNAADQYGDANKAESWACVRVAREAISALSTIIDVSTYAIKLEQIIEAICSGTKLPVSIPDVQHYKMAEKYLASQKQAAPVAAQPEQSGKITYQITGWGETDYPEVLYADTLDAAKDVVIAMVFDDPEGGKTQAEEERLLEGLDSDDDLPWKTTFEIGGIEVSKVFVRASLPSAQPVAAQEPVKSHDEIRTALYLAAISCGHSIESESVVLMRDERKPGNALAQLADRLLAAYLALPQPPAASPRAPAASDARELRAIALWVEKENKVVPAHPEFAKSLRAIADRIDAANQGESGKDAERIAALREAVIDAADEWSRYVEVDNAPRTCRKHIEMAFDAALAKKGGGK